MPRILVAHRGEASLEREAVAQLVALLRHRGHLVVSSAEQAGVSGGEVVDLEREAEAADHILLVDPPAWWSPGLARDPWEQALRERLELCLANEVEQFAVVLDFRREPDAPAGELLDAVPRFVLPAQWQPLLARLASPRASLPMLRTTGSLPTPQPAIRRPALEAILARAIARAHERGDEGHFIWIHGGIGSGKTALLSGLLAGDDAPIPILVHLARPSFAATLRPRTLLDRLAAALGLAQLDDLRELPRPTLIVIDGLEQLIDRRDGLVPEAERRRLAASLAGPLPAGLIVIASSRPLAPGLLGELEPTIDLDAPRWADEQRALVDALLSSADLGETRGDLRELAGTNPGAARALLDDPRSALGEGAVPMSFAATLERAFARLHGLPVPVRRSLLTGLSLLRAGFGPIPERLLAAAGGSDELPDLLEQHAAEWLRREPGGLALTHGFAARYLAAELDDRDPAPHLAILAGLARLRGQARLDLPSERYAYEHESFHQHASRGRSVDELWIRSLSNLRWAAEQGSLERRLEQAAAAGDRLLTAMFTIVRQHGHAITDDPSALPSLLWTGLVARGFAPATLELELSWADHRPPIRLQNALVQVDRCHRVLSGHEAPIRGCGLSDDASLAVTLDQHGELRSWDPRSGAMLQRVELGGWCSSCALTGDGSRVALAHTDKLLLLDPRTGERLGQHSAHADTVTAVAITPDGARVLSGDRKGGVILWEVSQERTVELGAHAERVTKCTLSSDGALGITGGGDKLIQVWPLGGGQPLELRGHNYWIGALALTRDDARLVSICIGEARVWDLQESDDCEIRCYHPLGQSCAGAVVVAGDHEVLTIEAGQRVTCWELDSGTILGRHLAHPADMHCVAASEDGEWYLTGGADKVARVWRRADMASDPLAGTVLPISTLLAGEQPNTVWVAGGGQGTRSISLEDPSEQRVLGTNTNYTTPNAIAQVGERLFVAGTRRQVTVYSLETGAELSHWEAGDDWLRCLAVDRERGRIVCAGDDNSLFVSDLEGGGLRTLAGHRDWVHALAFAPDGRLIAVDSAGLIKVWDLDTEQAVLEPQSSSSVGLYALVLDSTGDRLATSGAGGSIEIFALADGQLLLRLDGHVGAVRGLALRADDRVLASAGADQTLRLWSFADGRPLACLGVSFPLTQVAFVGERLVVGDVTGNVMIFEVDWSTIEP
ncbi:MAG: hypothetical protein R6X02_04555 [Enhygromyxa sp.]